MKVLAIDPGYEESGWIVFDGVRVLEHAIELNADLLRRVRSAYFVGVSAVVLEQIEGFGMPIGRDVIETVFWTGRFFEAATRLGANVAQRLPRKAAKGHLCGTTRASDANVRMALCDRFGGPLRAVGKTKTPGPLFGIKKHEWSALALGVVWFDLNPALKNGATQSA